MKKTMIFFFKINFDCTILALFNGLTSQNPMISVEYVDLRNLTNELILPYMHGSISIFPKG